MALAAVVYLQKRHPLLHLLLHPLLLPKLHQQDLEATGSRAFRPVHGLGQNLVPPLTAGVQTCRAHTPESHTHLSHTHLRVRSPVHPD